MISFRFDYDIGAPISSPQMVAQWIPGPPNALPFSGGRPSAADRPLQRLVSRLLGGWGSSETCSCKLNSSGYFADRSRETSIVDGSRDFEQGPVADAVARTASLESFNNSVNCMVSLEAQQLL